MLLTPLYPPIRPMLPTTTTNSMPMTVVMMTNVNPALRMITKPTMRAAMAVMMVARGRQAHTGMWACTDSIAEA